MPAPAFETKMAPMTAHSDFFLKLGDIKGESLDDKHKGEIDLMSFRFAVRQPGGSAVVGAGGGVGKAQFAEFEFTKRIDAASAKLMLACASGQHFPEVTLTCRRAGGTQADFLKIKLENVLVSGYESVGGDAAFKDTLPLDTFHLNFAKITYDYTAQNSDGTQGAHTQAGWDQLSNKKI
ncbi:MAG: type VI secretion system tube protein Hcp [Candidatus Acidiferrum sp.]